MPGILLYFNISREDGPGEQHRAHRGRRQRKRRRGASGTGDGRARRLFPPPNFERGLHRRARGLASRQPHPARSPPTHTHPSPLQAARSMDDKPAKAHRAPSAGRSADKKKPADKAAEKGGFNAKVGLRSSTARSSPSPPGAGQGLPASPVVYGDTRADMRRLAARPHAGLCPDLGPQRQPPGPTQGREGPDTAARPAGRPDARRRAAAGRRRPRRPARCRQEHAHEESRQAVHQAQPERGPGTRHGRLGYVRLPSLGSLLSAASERASARPSS